MFIKNGLQNGVCHNSQPCFSDEKSGSTRVKTPDEPSITNGELSPSSLRRSTRICALKAAEKIKLKESVSPLIEGYASNSVSSINNFIAIHLVFMFSNLISSR